jgi:hypothetical protein
MPVSFWMKNTLIPLDMVFIAGDGTIRHIHAKPCRMSTDTIPAHTLVRGVLEINGGSAALLGIKPGDKGEARDLSAPPSLRFIPVRTTEFVVQQGFSAFGQALLVLLRLPLPAVSSAKGAPLAPSSYARDAGGPLRCVISRAANRRQRQRHAPATRSAGWPHRRQVGCSAGLSPRGSRPHSFQHHVLGLAVGRPTRGLHEPFAQEFPGCFRRRSWS